MIILTSHAVEQFRTRFARDMPYDKAKVLLEGELPRADRLKQKSLKGDTLWKLPCGAYLVTKRDGRTDVAVTVLSEPRSPRRRDVHDGNMTLPEDEDDG